MNPRRILILTSIRWYNAAGDYAVNLAHGLAGRGHQVRLLTRPGSPVAERARHAGLDVHADADLTGQDPAAFLRGQRAFRRQVQEFRPEVVNPHTGPDHLHAALALRGSRVAIVRTRGDVRTPRPHPLNRYLYARAADRHVAAADFMPARFYPPLGVDPARVHVIRPGLDVDALSTGAPTPEAARRELGLDPERRWVGLIGRYTRVKGHRVLLEAVAALRDERIHVLFSGVPNDITADDLRGLAAGLGLGERLQVRGRLQDVRTGLRALDLLAVPSLGSEAIARIALEALALGLPVVASRVNSLPEIVGPAGLLVPPGEPGALAGAVRSAFESPDVVIRGGLAGPARIRNRYSPAELLQRTEAVFEEAARAKRG